MAGKRRYPDDIEGEHLKSRVAEALVEAMFVRGGFEVSRGGSDSEHDALSPNFMATKAIVRPDSDRPLHQVIPVAVQYHHDVPGFLREAGAQCAQWITQWPSVCLVVVTESPDAGRSCFQVVDLVGRDGRATEDLDKVPILDIYASTVREYEQLVRRLFRLLDRREPSR